MNVQVRFEPPRELPKEAWYAPRSAGARRSCWTGHRRGPTRGAVEGGGGDGGGDLHHQGDIFDWGIAGLGNIGGPGCVVSTYIYTKHSKTRGALLRRLGDLAVHEFGHTRGFPHCESEGCVMSDAKGKALSPRTKALASTARSVLRSCPPRTGP